MVRVDIYCDDGIFPATILGSNVVDSSIQVRCNHLAMRPLPLSEILSQTGHDLTSPKGVRYVLPFHNVCCRARVRVVDFFPPDLADFAVARRMSEYDVLSDSGSSESGDGDGDSSVQSFQRPTPTIRWEWRFCLLLEDGDPKATMSTKMTTTTRPSGVCRLKALVAHHDAEYLLKLDAEE